MISAWPQIPVVQTGDSRILRAYKGSTAMRKLVLGILLLATLGACTPQFGVFAPAPVVYAQPVYVVPVHRGYWR